MTAVKWRRIGFWSIALYALSLCLPALGTGNDFMWGFQAAAMSFIGTMSFFDKSGGTSGLLVTVFGFAANLLFLLGYVLLLFTTVRRPLRGVTLVAGIIAWLAGVCAFVSIVMILVMNPLNDSVNIGALPWFLSMVALALGCRRPSVHSPGGFPVLVTQNE
ncbi:MAG TPA: hypothetical protein VL282_17725 [Tepidisphaeraceae bacterium]|jgi:hypothetical protein|nr:hypothetical protein [Tepidisphaeraceae bacterium]